MANWCYTDYNFASDDTKAITDFYKRLEKVYNTKPNREPFSFQEGWLGDVAKEFLPEKYHCNEKTGESKIRLRGVINYISELDGDDESKCFTLSTETAWEPMSDIWFLINHIVYKGKLEISYMAEEPGCEVYIKHGAHFDDENYYVDYYYDNLYLSERFEKLDGIKSWAINEFKELGLTNSDFENKTKHEIETLINQKLKDANKDNWFSIHEFVCEDEPDIDEIERKTEEM